MEARKNFIFKLFLLELISYVPIAIIAGNVLPPIGFIKIHWIYIGVIFLLALLILLSKRRSSGQLLLIFLFLLIQLVVSIKFSIIDFIDFISGPIVFIAVVNTIVEDEIDIKSFQKTIRKMLFFLGIPIVIAFLQYLNIVPLELLNAEYVNVTIYGSEKIERVNGFLYHGIELAVIIFFFFTSILILKSSLNSYVILLLMIFAEFITTIKTGIISAILFTGYFSYLIDRRLRLLKSILIFIIIILGFSYMYTLIPDIQENRFRFNSSQFKFDDQLFTGRGYIWNTYIQGITHFDFFQIFFGAGFGSAPTIFEQNSTNRVEWSAGTHNQLLELFINGGLFAIILMFSIIRKQYQKLTEFFSEGRSIFSKYFIGILIIPLITMGVTSPIMSMFIYWCGLCLTILSLRLKLLNSAK
jgi:hypothetical protein